MRDKDEIELASLVLPKEERECCGNCAHRMSMLGSWRCMKIYPVELFREEDPFDLVCGLFADNRSPIEKKLYDAIRRIEQLEKSMEDVFERIREEK